MEIKQKLIYTTEYLRRELGSSFILLIGSAVSGRNYPCLPMVDDVMNNFFENISALLEKRSKENNKRNDIEVIAKYTKSLCSGEKNNYLLGSTKFEEFLGILQLILDREKLDELLRILYCCHPNEFGRNQSAISWLIESGKCSLCLTTNFDNSIEKSSNSIEPYTHKDYQTIKNKIENTPILLKLHGDVNDNSCVATNRSIFEHATVKTYNFLVELLSGEKVLVLGYSGNGDVDISPNFLQAQKERGADFYWCEYKESNPVPVYSKYKVICDLSSNDVDKNLLLGLANSYGWDDNYAGAKHEWKTGLKDWCDSISHEKIAKILIQILIKKPGWEVVHVMTLYPYSLESKNPTINEGIACLQKSAYGAAKKKFTRLVNNEQLNQSDQITSKLYLGFVQWRMGKFNSALQTLDWFYYIDSNKYKEIQRVQISHGHRFYLEVIRDWMQLHASKSKRQMIYKKYKVTDYIKKYKSLETFDLTDDLLKQAILLHIEYLKEGRKDKRFVDEISKLFDLCWDTQNWDIAEAVGRFFIGVSFIKGLLALKKVDCKLIKRKQWNLIRKSIAAILNKITFGMFPWLTIGLIDSPILYSIVSIFRNFQYQYKVSYWEKQRCN